MVKISELKYGCDGLPLEIRILRKWIPHYRQQETWYLAVDKNEDGIGLLGENAAQQYLQSKLQISKCYSIERYTCSETPRSQRILKNPINLNLGSATMISPIEDSDIIGTYKKHVYGVKKDLDPLLYLTLTDFTGHEVIVTLWKECIHSKERFDQAAMSTVSQQTVIVVTNVRPSVYATRLRAASTDATYVFFNPPASAQTSPSQALLMSAQSTALMPSSLLMTIQELLKKTHSYLHGKTIGVDARIQGFEIEDSWYISACNKCKARIPKQGQKWFCASDGVISNPIFYFSLNAVIDDGTETLKVMLTDAFIQKLTGTTAERLVLVDGFDDRKTLPVQIEQHKVPTYKLSIELSKKATPNKMMFVLTGLLQRHIIGDLNQSPVTPEKQNLSPSFALTPTSTPPQTVPPTDTLQTTTPVASTPVRTTQTSAAKRLKYGSSDDVTSLHVTKRADQSTIETTEPLMASSVPPMQTLLTEQNASPAVTSSTVPPPTATPHSGDEKATGKRLAKDDTDEMAKTNPGKRTRYTD